MLDHDTRAAEGWQRCFIALSPDAATREALAAVPVPPDSRRVPDGQLHLTVTFIGALRADTADALAAALHASAARLAPAAFERIECWPGTAHPRLLVATLAMSDDFVALDWRVRSLMIELGLPVDARAFRPHITLARFARGATAATIPADARLPPFARFESLVLYSSTLARQGARYQALASVAVT